jgi:PHD/YefM family antitoxin component YafN of YafNO toxin-antitoxin module
VVGYELNVVLLRNGLLKGVPMNRIMETRPVSEMNRNPNAILELLAAGPVVLMQRSVPAGVLVSPKEWNSLFDRLEALENAVEIWKGKYELATGRNMIMAADIAELTAVKETQSAVAPSPRVLDAGQWKGKIKIADDFDELPDDLLKLFTGETEEDESIA